MFLESRQARLNVRTGNAKPPWRCQGGVFICRTGSQGITEPGNPGEVIPPARRVPPPGFEGQRTGPLLTKEAPPELLWTFGRLRLHAKGNAKPPWRCQGGVFICRTGSQGITEPGNPGEVIPPARRVPPAGFESRSVCKSEQTRNKKQPWQSQSIVFISRAGCSKGL